ncbi:hypothetical protein B0H63DRAFT_416761 [Podospora didyma]|uniref:Uncharacterized protein n=1 Tax=Podospora didyma TaxID=330526 RepID=A0AAE0NI50_9PEZI|nr:hypothetical protein B0H63DRAFT_416761 [Podospora didyma]
MSPEQTSPAPAGFNHDLVTLIITTSPTPSAPSTELIESVLRSFGVYCPPLLKCRVILAIDTYDHITEQARLKKGVVTPEFAKQFDLYKENAKNLLLREYAPLPAGESHELVVSSAEAEFGSNSFVYLKQNNSVPYTITQTQDKRVTFIEPQQRLGFGLAVRSALRLTETPYVWVHQHDWAMVADIPFGPLLELMREADASEAQSLEDVEFEEKPKQPKLAPIKYICLPSVRMLNYATSDHVLPFHALRNLTNKLKQNFIPLSSSPLPNITDGTTAGNETKTASIPLTPLFLWHDKPHLASTEHYLQRVFPNRMAMLRGAFIEDTVGHRARSQMKEGNWKKWACWLYYPDDGKKLCLRHLKGRTFRGTEVELAKKMEWLQLKSSVSEPEPEETELEETEPEIELEETEPGETELQN